MKRHFKKNYYRLTRWTQYGAILTIVALWVFIGRPQIYLGVPFPPDVMEAGAIAEVLSPDGAGTYQEWDVTGAATHWQAVNDNSDTTYISTGVDEERDIQTLANVSSSIGFVQQVDVVMRCVVSGGGGAAEQAANFIREGSTDTTGTQHSISRSAYTLYTTSYTTNPRTGIAWTMGEVNSVEAGVRLKVIGAGESVRCSEIYVSQTSATAKMSAYRWFTNANSTDVGAALAAQDTAYTLTSDGQAFRLRLLLHVADTTLAINSEPMKLQFATKSGTCDTAYSGESWSDVTASTAIGFNNNATPADEATLTVNGSDPSDGHTKVTQTYQEANNFQNSVGAVPSAQDGIWDFSLIDFSAPSGTSYCFRVIKSDANVITTPTVVPEINTLDNIAPTITNVSSDKTNGSYKAGEVIDIDVTFSEAVTSTGNVTVELETGVTDQTCTFTVSAATTGTCNYTVQAGDTSADLTVKTISGTINDQALNAMTNYVPTTNLAANKALVIDTTVPVISSTAPATSASINSITTSSDVSYTLSEAIASGTIVMTRTGGTADASSPRTCTLVGTALNTGAHSAFDMSNTTNGCTIAQSLVDGTVYTFAFNATDVAGNAATQVSNTGVTFDTTAPTVTTLSPADNATGVSTTANLVMTFSETVAVNSTGSSGPNNGGTFADDASVGTLTWNSVS
ncbi:MAG: Ig-like domain-containing protein, partial [Patescibacteria group bacterium]